MPKDPYAQAAVFLVAAFMLIGAIAIGAVVIVPVAVVGGGGMLAYKLFQAYQSSQKTKALDAELRLLAQTTSFPDPYTFACNLIQPFIKANLARLPTAEIAGALARMTEHIYEAEGLNKSLPPPATNDAIELARWRDSMVKHAERIRNPALVEIADRTITESIKRFHAALPPIATTTREAFNTSLTEETTGTTVPLMEVLPNVGKTVEDCIAAYYSKEAMEAKLFTDLREQFDRNMREVSGDPKDDSKLILPSEHAGTPREIVYGYLKDTPLCEVFSAAVPFIIPDRIRMEHTVIVAGSGWGKTQLLQSIIAEDLSQDDPPSLIVLDSTGAMIDRIQKLAVFDTKLRDRILIIDPAHSPALNMFDVSTPRFERYTDEQKEDVQTEVVDLFNYIFASEDYDLSSQMGLAFTYAVRLMLSRHGSTITDLRHLLEETPKSWEGSAFKDDIERLDDDSRAFFERHFFTASLIGTRASIARRLHNVISVPAFRRMFTASANTLDLFDEMQKGTIVLVNTNQQLLKDDAMVLFGRFVIAKALSSALERATVPEAKRRQTYLIVDEASPYFDQTFESLLTRVRQFKLGVVIAFQHLEQASEKLRSAIASSTSIKYAGGLGFSDRRWLAREMETTPEFIGAQRKDRDDPPAYSRFAVYVRNFTEHALSITVPFFKLENMDRMSEEAHEALLERNRERVSVIAAPEVRPRPVQAEIPKPTAKQTPDLPQESGPKW